MPTDTMTAGQVVDILATKGMGWLPKLGGWLDEDEEFHTAVDWDPLSDLNIIRRIEERLSVRQERQYIDVLCPDFHFSHDTYWRLRHVSAHTCAFALAKVLKGRP